MKLQKRIGRTIKAPPSEYRNGASGFIKWVEEYCLIPIYPEGSDIAEWVGVGDLPDVKNPVTGRSYKYIWDEQKKIMGEALRMEEGRFIYRLIVLCWPRGEGKSLLACLIVLWKFFNWPRQQIMLGANSKEQVKFVHFDIMAAIIMNSPKLYALVGGKRNIQEKEIRLKDTKNAVRSLIRSISSFSGIVSNITNYTFSEIFDMKNPKFFVQLDGSIRNMPNSFGVIDSTVSAKTHVLYDLYMGALEGKTKTTFFSYRYSTTGDQKDYWNPNMNTIQLEDYRVKFPFGEFERYFLNLWSAGVNRIFTDEMIEETLYMGADGLLLNHEVIRGIIQKKDRLLEVMGEMSKRGLGKEVNIDNAGRIESLYNRLTPVDSLYTLTDKYGQNMLASVEDLDNIGDKFDTNFAVMAGMDFGDPYAAKGLARTIVTIIAKGYPGSRSNPMLMFNDNISPKYLYFILHMLCIPDHSLDTAKELLETVNDEFSGLDAVCSERYGAWDVAKWCEERDIAFEPIYPNYGRQKDAFKEMFLAIKEGRLKGPPIPVPGSKKDDILREEMSQFDHDADKKWFGSAEKFEKYGIQDDSIFTVGWCLYGGRLLTVDDFRTRKSTMLFGSYYPSKGLIGNYA